MEIKLSDINLNLLTVLDAILTERHITKAATQLGLTQSAVSNSLKQLRELFEDDLLVKSLSNQMVLTHKGEIIKKLLKEALVNISKILIKGESFDPATADISFTIGMSDYVASVLLKKILSTITEKAPKVKINIRPVTYLLNSNQLRSDDFDLLIGNDRFLEAGVKKLNKQTLFVDKYICAGSKKHRAFKTDGKTIPLQALKKYPHIRVFHGHKETPYEVSKLMDKFNSARKTIMELPFVTIAPYLTQNSKMLCILPQLIFNKYASSYNLSSKEFPKSILAPAYPVSQYWQPVDENDPAHIWLRNTFKDLTRNIKSLRGL